MDILLLKSNFFFQMFSLTARVLKSENLNVNDTLPSWITAKYGLGLWGAVAVHQKCGPACI